jgi:hypothetical protein
LEPQIDSLKQTIQQIEDKFADTELMKDTAKALELNKQYDIDKKRLAETEHQYEQLFIQMMELEQNA